MRDFQTAPNKVGLLDQKTKTKHLYMSNCDYQTLGVILHQKDKVLHVLVDYYSYFVLIFERCYA